MKIAQIVALLLLALPSVALAENGKHSAIPKTYRSATAQEAADISSGLKTSNLLRNANECAPDVAEPVWDSGTGRLAFSCHAPLN
jgi:hypothetical protein